MEKVFSPGNKNLELSVKVPRLLRLLSAALLILLIVLLPPIPASADQASWTDVINCYTAYVTP
jgi:hypothetical protein